MTDSKRSGITLYSKLRGIKSALIEKNQLLHKPLVSFVIPVLNGEKDIGRCLASIRNLECAVEEYEIIVVDNGSTDRSRQIIKESGVEAYVFPKLRVGALRNR